jgi:hypothetical protein
LQLLLQLEHLFGDVRLHLEHDRRLHGHGLHVPEPHDHDQLRCPTWMRLDRDEPGALHRHALHVFRHYLGNDVQRPHGLHLDGHHRWLMHWNANVLHLLVLVRDVFVPDVLPRLRLHVGLLHLHMQRHRAGL